MHSSSTFQPIWKGDMQYCKRCVILGEKFLTLVTIHECGMKDSQRKVLLADFSSKCLPTLSNIRKLFTSKTMHGNFNFSHLPLTFHTHQKICQKSQILRKYRSGSRESWLNPSVIQNFFSFIWEPFNEKPIKNTKDFEYKYF